MTFHNLSPDELASPDKDSEDELPSDIDKSLKEYSILGLDKSSSEPMRIDGVRS